jgi:hypothetical protein
MPSQPPLQRDQLEPLLTTLASWLSNESINRLSVASKIVGGRDTGQLCISVGLQRKRALEELGPNDFAIPPTVELHIQNPDGSIVAVDVPTDVVEVGMIEAARQTVVVSPRARPAPGGYTIAVKTGESSQSVGTLGANIVYGGRYRMLTNNHVISHNGNIGVTVYQPEYAQQGNDLTKVEDFIPMVTYPDPNQPSPTRNTHDLAWAAIDPHVGASEIVHIGKPTGIRAPVLGEEVRWIGESTAAVQKAKITSVETMAKIKVHMGGGRWAWFHHVVEFDGGTAAQGDSGAAVVATSDMNIVALIFAIDGNKAGYAARI